MPPDLVLPLLAATVLGSYAVVCVIWPYSTCGKCAGRGQLTSPSGKHHRICPRCRGGSRKRLRLGRKVLNVVSVRAREASNSLR